MTFSDARRANRREKDSRLRYIASVDDSDERLLSATKAGDEAALEALLERHAPTIQRFASRLCRDREDAQDVVQETLLAAARGMREVRGAAALSTWLYKIARSHCTKARRTSKFAPKTLDAFDETAVASQEPPPDRAASERETVAALENAIHALEPDAREALVLRDVEGLSANEAADVLGISVDALKSRLHRARGQVRAKLEPILLAEPLPGCPDIVTTFSRHLEGEIGTEECAVMEKHVAGCKRCGAACDSLRRVLALCRAQPQGDVPRELQALVKKTLRDLQNVSDRSNR
jgi:RNA polymerase sigma-70 factor (ECF subfamily)